MCGVAGHADATLVESRHGVGAGVEDGPHVQVLVRQLQEADHVVPVAPEVTQGVLPLRRPRQLLVVGPVVRRRAEGHDVELLAAVDGEGEDVAVLAHEHARVPRPLVADGLDGDLHGHEPPVRVLVRVRGAGGRVVCADDHLPHAGLDTVAPDDGVGRCRRPVLEVHHELSVLALLHLHQPLSELGFLLGQVVHQLVQVVRPVDAVLAQAGLDGERNVLVVALGPVDVVEPGVLLLLPAVAGADLLERLVDAGVDCLHGLHGVGAEGNSSADLAKVGGGLVEHNRDVAVVEGDGKRQAGNATTNNGDLEVLARCHDDCCAECGMEGRLINGLYDLFHDVLPPIWRGAKISSVLIVDGPSTEPPRSGRAGLASQTPRTPCQALRGPWDV